MINVVKRDGRQVPFEERKIEYAILAAMRSALPRLYAHDYKYAKDVGKAIREELGSSKEVSVEEIQDCVEKKLLDSEKYKDVAVSYIRYRAKRSQERGDDNELVRMFAEKLNNVQIDSADSITVNHSNANVDESSFGGRKGQAADIIAKEWALRHCMSKKSRGLHLSNHIYVHDLDSFALGNHNCLSVPFDDLLKDGFKSRQCDVRPANSINTAFQQEAVLFQLQSLQQFGGVSATHLDWTMVPYVRKSFYKHFKDGVKYLIKGTFHLDDIEGTSITGSPYTDYPESVYQYALDMTTKETYQAVEGMYHNLNTLQSRSGNQLPFSSINFGTCTLEEGRMVIKALLDVLYKGVGPKYQTSIFPCVIFQYKEGVNDREGTKNYDMYRLALQCTARRLYPNYANCGFSGQKTWIAQDRKVKQEVLDSLTEAEYQDLMKKLIEKPELQSALGLSVEE